MCLLCDENFRLCRSCFDTRVSEHEHHESAFDTASTKSSSKRASVSEASSPPKSRSSFAADIIDVELEIDQFLQSALSTPRRSSFADDSVSSHITKENGTASSMPPIEELPALATALSPPSAPTSLTPTQSRPTPKLEAVEESKSAVLLNAWTDNVLYTPARDEDADVSAPVEPAPHSSQDKIAAGSINRDATQREQAPQPFVSTADIDALLSALSSPQSSPQRHSTASHSAADTDSHGGSASSSQANFNQAVIDSLKSANHSTPHPLELSSTVTEALNSISLASPAVEGQADLFLTPMNHATDSPTTTTDFRTVLPFVTPRSLEDQSTPSMLPAPRDAAATASLHDSAVISFTFSSSQLDDAAVPTVLSFDQRLTEQTATPSQEPVSIIDQHTGVTAAPLTSTSAAPEPESTDSIIDGKNTALHSSSSPSHSITTDNRVDTHNTADDEYINTLCPQECHECSLCLTPAQPAALIRSKTPDLVDESELLCYQDRAAAAEVAHIRFVYFGPFFPCIFTGLIIFRRNLAA